METAEQIMQAFYGLEGAKGQLNSHCQEISTYMLPRQAVFFRTPTMYNEGERRSQKVIDPFPEQSLINFASLYESVPTPRSDLWHRLKFTDRELMKIREVKEWLDTANQMLFDLRYSSRSNFASQNHENNISVGAFGTGVLITEEGLDRIIYRSSHLSEHHLVENADGIIDTNYRRCYLTPAQAYQKFGDALPD